MSHQKLTIVPPVSIHPEGKNTITSTTSEDPSNSICTIKIAATEISFFNGIEEHIIQSVMRELKNL
ncbi:hypothetical protein [Gracilibacillus boraciitolerans]|uniref:hypothetical protein n=1 Tax=Gracilibacillus boraciitolerans TaxID=307521 RepID=UPI00055916A2|nr:hypothetical protein [Gracilibacillus boraciitolerans]